LLLLFSTSVFANFFDQAKVQYAGEIGLVAYGLGFMISDNYNLDLLYGIVPEDYSGTEAIETLAIKNNYPLIDLVIKKQLLQFYLGWSIYHVIGLNYQTSRNGAAPRNYYRLGSLRGLFYYGISHQVSQKHGWYFENGMNDIWLTNYFNNQKSIDPADYMSMALGYQYIF
jgi:hypothetical protein